MRLRLLTDPARYTRRLPFAALAAVALALICGQVTSPAAGEADTEPATRDLPAIAETMRQAIAALPDGRHAFGQALADEALAALRDGGAMALSRHQTKLLVNTVTYLAQSTSPTAEEIEYRKAWMYMATQRLVRAPVTEEETARFCSQCTELSRRLCAVAGELVPDGAAEFQEKLLTTGNEGLLRCARSLLNGGPMHPMAPEQLDDLVAVFRQSIESGEGPNRPGVRLGLAMAAVSFRLRRHSTGFGPADNTPRVAAAIEAKRKALQRHRDAETAEFEALHYGSIMRSTMGGYVRLALASTAAVDALALWHELIQAAAPRPGEVRAAVAAEFWDDGALVAKAAGTVDWSAEAEETTEAALSGQDPARTWLADVWDGLELRLARTGNTVGLRSGLGSAEIAGTALPVEIPPLAQCKDAEMATDMALQATSQRLLWGAIVPLWQQGEAPPVDLSRLYAPGLAPLLWRSVPRATSAERAGEHIVLRDATGQVVARLVGGGQADAKLSPGLPETIEIELAHRQVTGMLAMTVQGKGRKEVTSALDLDVRSARLQFRSVSGVVLLDEYKAFREDGTPLCIVTFGDVQVKAPE